MPWKTEDAPEGLPEHAKEIWAKAATAALAKYKDEKKAIATAWSAVKRAGYAKGEDGKWHRGHTDNADGSVTVLPKYVYAWYADRTGEDLAEMAPRDKQRAITSYNLMCLADHDFLDQTGKHWGPVLRHVAFLGAQAPAVKGLKDAVSLGQEHFEKEILRVGTWVDSNGRTLKVDDDYLDRFIANFHALKGVEGVPLIMAAVHDEKEFQRILADEGRPSLGWVDDVKRVGSGAVAVFKQAAKIAKDLIMEGRYAKCSVRITPDYVFGEAATDDCFVSYEPSREEGEDMAEEKKYSQADVDALVKAKVDTALTEAKTKAETELAEAKKKAEEADKALAEERKARTDSRIKGFAESLKSRRVAPVVATEFTELAEALDNTEEVEFAEGKKATALERMISFTETVLGLAEGKEKKKLFVPEGTVGTGEDFVAGEHDADEEKNTGALVKELAEMSDRVPTKA